ncbi:hypothetical protein [Uliginosibacterium gangwonense]|uniref:hypothetical protein n=1 Tax=Uliginosibacterium gangwonense TaxID=392736 RepID=UPI0003749062|nr:hypothetical protein [Uliginosibacterium gangwonense]
MKTIVRNTLAALAAVAATSAASSVGAATTAQISTAVTNAYGWLDSQYGLGCIASFRNDYNDNYTLVNGVYKLVTPRAVDNYGYTYDQALAVMAYLQDTRSGNTSVAKAQAILNKFKSLQKSEGSWATAYTCTGNSATSGAEAEPYTDVGPSVWVGLAALAYRTKYPSDTSYDDMIINVARYVSTIQWKTQWGGDGGVNFASNRLQSVGSTEHNLDVYALLTGIKNNATLYAKANQTLTGDYSIDSARASVTSFLTNTVWNAGELRFNGGRNDSKFPTDMLNWGSAAMGDDYNNAYYSLVKWAVETSPSPFEYNSGVDFVNSRERANQGTYFNSWWDYFSASAYTNGDLAIVNDKIQDTWYEGTGQMVVALKMAKAFYAAKAWGTTAIQSKIDTYLGTLVARQQSDGGLRYSDRGTSNTYFRMKTATSAAGTAWLIFGAKGFNPFYPFAKSY